VGPNRRQRRYVPDRAVRLRILTVPEAKDPDDFIRGDPARWPTVVQAAKPVIDFVLERLEVRHDLASAQGKAAAAAEISEVLAGVANPIEQAHYVQQVAHLLKVDETSVRQSLPRKQRSPRAEIEAPAQVVVDGNKEDEYALALVKHSRRVLGTQMLFDEADFALPQSRALQRALSAGLAEFGELDPYMLRVDACAPDLERFSPDQFEAEVRRVRLSLRERALLGRRAQVQLLMKEAATPEEQREWGATLIQLAHELHDLDQQLRHTRPHEATAA
jgi:DNA primase